MRAAKASDVDGLFHVRCSVRENLQTRDELAGIGITPESVAAMLASDCRGWVAEDEGGIVAFTMADRTTSSIFALSFCLNMKGAASGNGSSSVQ